jgi:alpha-1,6-mannosyltransferase
LSPSRIRRPAGLPVFLEILAWAAVSVAAYALMYRVQRRLFLNGVPTDPYDFPRSTADPLAAQQALRSYLLIVTVVVLSYVWLLVRSRSPGWRALAWMPLTLLGLGNLFMLRAKPSFSIDILSYLSHGYLAVTPGHNPYADAASDVGKYPYGAALTAEGWSAVHSQSPYPPLWTHIEALAYRVSDGDVDLGLVAIKAVVLAAVLGSAVLVGSIARKIRPEWATPAACAFLGNPVVIMEFAGDGHNDALAVFFTLLAIRAALADRVFPAVVALGLSVLTKYTPIVFALPILVILLRGRRPIREVIWHGLAGGAFLVVLTALLWQKWWIGAATFSGVSLSGTRAQVWSPASWLIRLFTDPVTGESGWAPRLILGTILLVTVLVFSWSQSTDQAMVGCAVIALVMVLVLPTYWPWYAALPIAILALRPTWLSLGQLLVITIGSRIAAPYGDLAALDLVDSNAMLEQIALRGVALPAAGCLLLAVLGFGLAAARKRGRLALGGAGKSSPNRSPGSKRGRPLLG